MSKCTHCNKTVTKKNPGLECNKCGCIVHATTSCTDLSNKQLNVVRSAENLEWTCNNCSQKSMRRGSSLIIPDDDAEDEEDTFGTPYSNYPFDQKKFLAEITVEMDKLLKREIKETNKAIQFCCAKVDDCLEFMETFKGKIKDLEKKNTDLLNQNRHLELRMQVLEQRVNEEEQKKLSKVVEIQGLPSTEGESLEEIAKKLACKLKVNAEDIKTVKRLPMKYGRPGALLVNLHKEENTTEWVSAARNVKPTAIDVVTNLPEKEKSMKILVFRALTPHFKGLLWAAKQKLKDTYKYIWCKDAKVMVRKSDKEKTTIIRSESDIKHLMQ